MDLKIDARNVIITPEWQARIDEEIARLEERHPGLVHHFRLTLIATRHQRLGFFEAHVVASVPQDTIVVKESGELVLPLLVKCFDVLDRKILEYNRRRQQLVKQHEERLMGTVSALVAPQDYGLITALDGDEIYFHRHAVQDTDFDELHEGDAVFYGEGRGDKGPQATWVRRR
jgi:cold shock CspA family protein/ribosome-associated translation inhibitor RaiA